jgi:hypothetical protein
MAVIDAGAAMPRPVPNKPDPPGAREAVTNGWSN